MYIFIQVVIGLLHAGGLPAATEWRHSEHPRQDAEADEACARLVQSAENQRQCSDVCRGQGGLSVEPEQGMLLKGGHLLGGEVELE